MPPYLIQDVGPIHGRGGPSLALIGLLLVAACAGVIAYKLADLAALRIRRALLSRRRERAAATVELRCRSQMSELCPHGWRAQITLFDNGDELPQGAPRGDWARVALDWAELDRDRGGSAVARRVWARTIAEALERMVADRRTDETLEQIEQGAVADGAEWPDL